MEPINRKRKITRIMNFPESRTREKRGGSLHQGSLVGLKPLMKTVNLYTLCQPLFQHDDSAQRRKLQNKGRIRLRGLRRGSPRQKREAFKIIIAGDVPHLSLLLACKERKEEEGGLCWLGAKSSGKG